MSQDLVLTALLDFTFNTLETALAEEPQVEGVEAEERESRRERRKKRRKQQGEEPFEGRWWKKSVPGTKRWIPYILKYIEKGGINVGFYDLPVWDGDLTSITPDEKGLTFSFNQKFLGGTETTDKRVIAYPNEKVSSICQGKETHFGKASVQIDRNGLLFDTSMLPDGTGVISWKNLTVRYDGWAFFDLEMVIDRIEIGKAEGEVILGGNEGILKRIKNAFTPRLVWQ